MKSKVVPAILIAAIVVAGIFAFQPVETAKAVHFIIIAAITAIIEANNGQVFESGAISAGVLTGGTTVTLTCEEDYRVFGITLDMVDGATYGGDIIDVAIDGDDIATDIPLVAGAVAVLDGQEAADFDELTVITFIMTDDTDEAVENIRFSVATTGDCEIT